MQWLNLSEKLCCVTPYCKLVLSLFIEFVCQFLTDGSMCKKSYFDLLSFEDGFLAFSASIIANNLALTSFAFVLFTIIDPLLEYQRIDTSSFSNSLEPPLGVVHFAACSQAAR